jgi:Flp pilus assembly protein TadD
VNVLLDEGISLNSRGKHEEALAVYDTAISMKPKSNEAWNNKGFVLKNTLKKVYFIIRRI